MQKGISSYLFIQEELTIDRLETVRSSGFERLEIFAIRPHFEYQNKTMVTALGSWLSGQGPFLNSIHTPISVDYQALRNGDYLSIADLVKIRREKAVDEIKRALELAEKVRFPFAVVHTGAPGDEYNLKHLDALYYSLETLAPFARERGVKLALENIPNRLSQIEKICGFLQETRLQNVGICFDSGHSNLQASPSSEIETGANWIVTTHLHDNHGETDEHLLPFDGTIEWTKVLEAFRKIIYPGCLLLELKSGNHDPLQILKSAYQIFDRFNKCQEELEESKGREE
jgi:sugar phosphate isomerase/epimerase